MARTVLRLVGADIQSGLHQLNRHPERIVAIVVAGFFIGPPLCIGLIAGGAALGARAPGYSQGVLTAAFAGIGLMLLVFGLHAAIGKFFTDRGLLFLLTAPVSPAEVFATKLASSFWLVGLFWAPLLMLSFGIGLGRRAGVIYMLVAIIICLGWTVAMIAAQVAVLSLVLRVVPARRARDATMAVSILGVLLLSSSQLALLGVRRGDFGALFAQLNRLSWLPSAWPARALEAFARGDVAGGLAAAGVSMLAVAALVAVSGVLYRQSLVIGVGALAEGATPVRLRRRKPNLISRPAAPIWGLVRKDWRVMRRDTRRLVQFVPAVIFGVIYPLVQLRNLPGGGRFSELAFWLQLSWLGFLPFMISSGLALPAVAQEGRALQLLRLAPRSPAWVIRAKLWFALPPAILAAAAGAVLVLELERVSAGGVAVGVAMSCWWAAGFSAIALAGGAIWPNLGTWGGLRGVTLSGTVMVLIGDAAFGISSLAGVALLVFAVSGRLPFGGAFALLGLGLMGAAAAAALAFVVVALDRLAHAEPGE